MAKNFQYSSHRGQETYNFFSFSYYNFEDAITDFEKDMFKKIFDFQTKFHLYFSFFLTFAFSFTSLSPFLFAQSGN